MFEQTFRNIDDVLWKEAGCATELDYTEQTSWILFLKYLDDLERANEQKAELQGKTYQYILDKPHRWSAWAAPKKRDGTFDHDKALTGDDLIEFVNRDLFPYLQKFKTQAEGANTIEYRIGEIFGEIKNKFQNFRKGQLYQCGINTSSGGVDCEGRSPWRWRSRFRRLSHSTTKS
jgi:type I restriction enzyme M protein